jgi:uncharacterized protein
MTILLCLLIGLVGGVSGGLFGIGGGVVIVPAMILLLGFSQHRAQGTSLVALLAPVGIFGVANYYKAGNVDLKLGLIIALGFLGGAYIGSKVALSLDETLLRRIFATFLVFLAIQLFLKK